MNLISVYLVDDNPDALDMLEEHLTQISGFELSGKETNSVKASQVLIEGEVRADIVVLDFEMPGLAGYELGRKLMNIAAIIYVSGHPEYGPQASDVQAAAYLEKPVRFEKFKEALYRAKTIYEKRILIPDLPLRPFYFVPGTGKEARLMIKPEDLLYIQADSNYSTIYMTDGKEITTYRSLKYLANMLPEPYFFRINKSNIISLSKIIQYTALDVILQQGKTLAFGASYRSAFIEMLQRFRMI